MQRTCFQACLLLFLLAPDTLLLLATQALLLAGLENSSASLRLLLLHVLLRQLFPLRKLLSAPRADGLLHLLDILDHARQATLRLEVCLERRPVGLNAGLLRLLKDCTVVGLLLLVVLRKERALLLAVGTLNVIHALGENAHALVELLLLLLELLHLEAHEVVGAETLDVLSRMLRITRQ